MNISTLPRVNGRVAAGTCGACGYVNATTNADTMICAGCSTRVRLTYVAGNLNDRQPCDSRCQYAWGPNCSCSCGGDNHRAGYINPHLVPVWVRDRDRDRHTAKADKRAAQVAAAQQRAEDDRAVILDAHPELADLLTDRYAGPATSNFMLDMRAALLAGDMSPRQVEAACNAVNRDRERTARWSVWDAAHDAARTRGMRITAGRQTVTGVVIRLVEKQSTFTYHERTYFQVTVQDDDGRRFTGTLPEGLHPEWDGRWSDAYVGWPKRAPGQRITLTVTVKPPRPDDPLHAYYSHPRVPDGAARLLARPGTPAPDQGVDAPTATPAAPATPGSWADLFNTLNTLNT